MSELKLRCVAARRARRIQLAKDTFSGIGIVVAILMFVDCILP